MNISEFIDWRPKCFFCGGHLFVQPNFPQYPASDGERTDCSIVDELVHFAAQYIKFSVDTKSGLIQSSDTSPELPAFIARQPLEVSAKCFQCPLKGIIYSHTAVFRGDNSRTHYVFKEIIEKIVVDRIYLLQSREKQSGIVKAINSRGRIDRDKEFIEIPYIDLSKSSPDKVTNKIKTYIVFS